MIKKGHAYKNAKYTSVSSSNLKHHVNRSEIDADSVYMRISKMAEPFRLPMMFKMELGKCHRNVRLFLTSTVYCFK